MTVTSALQRRALNHRRVKEEFPIFDPAGPNAGLVYLDTGASAQKPRAVIDAVSRFYAEGYANIHRGVYRLSALATEAYEGARETVRRFINARSAAEIVFVRGATEAINLVAQSWGPANLKPGDELLITALEHHANIVPWQMLRDRLGFTLRVIPVRPDGGLDMDAFAAMLSPRVKLVATTHVSNAIGTVVDLPAITRQAHALGSLVLVDGCQAVAHRPVDVQAIGADFYVFSGHKLYGPTGIGVLYGRAELLAGMPPWQSGGDMILSVDFERTTFQEPPHRFEAGTPDIAGAIGLDQAIRYVEEVGWDYIEANERDLIAHGLDVLGRVEGLDLVGAGDERAGIFSFTIDAVHPHDLGTILDQRNIAVRAGHHCAQPLLDCLGVHATVRASLGMYNEARDLDILADALAEARAMFRR